MAYPSNVPSAIGGIGTSLVIVGAVIPALALAMTLVEAAAMCHDRHAWRCGAMTTQDGTVAAARRALRPVTRGLWPDARPGPSVVHAFEAPEETFGSAFLQMLLPAPSVRELRRCLVCGRTRENLLHPQGD
jgi:hypothetical protein